MLWKLNKVSSVLTSATVSYFLLAGQSLHAEIIIDPDNVGATRVFPNLESSPTGTSQINVGYSGAHGSVEINADSTGNGFTEVSGSALLVGQGGGAADGLVRIIGDGTSGSAQATISNGVGTRIGFGGNGQLELRNGGVLESTENIHLGEDVSGNVGNTTVTVDGAGSVLRSSTETGVSYGDGGRIYIPFSRASSSLTISNGGLVDAVGGDLAEFEDGSIYIGTLSEDFHADVRVEITGADSTMRAQHGIYIMNELGDSSVNITNGGQLEVTDENYIFGGVPEASLAIGSLVADGANLSVSDTSSSVSVFGDISIGTEFYVLGFTASGDPRRRYSTDGKSAGDQVVDSDGTPLFKPNGEPLLFVDADFGGFTALVPENAAPGADNSAYQVKTTGHMVVENGATVDAGGDIHISTNNANPLVQPLSGQDSSLTIRSGGEVTAENIFVNEHGILHGDGGIIHANVEVNGGTLSPGDSPGIMSIFGDLTLNDGLLKLEIGDLLDVSGNIFLGEDLMIELLFSSDPAAGETIDLFSFFDFDGTFTSFFDPFSNLRFAGLSGDAFFSITGFNGEQLFVDRRSNSVPEPNSVLLLILGLIGLLATSHRARTICA